MKAADVKQARSWFRSYVKRFAAKDGSLHPTHAVKVAHSVRVARECRGIAAALRWKPADVAAAEAMGLLHDVARFPQFEKFRTLMDSDSINHGELGYKIIRDSDLASGWKPADTRRILAGIRYHNRHKPSNGIAPDAAAFLKLIRDADKLDIIGALTRLIAAGDFTSQPELFLGVDPDGPATPALVREVEQQWTGSYCNVHSLIDMNLIRTSWIYDLNYLPSLRAVVSRGLLDDIVDVLPDTREMRKIAAVTRRYVDGKMKELARTPRSASRTVHCQKQ